MEASLTGVGVPRNGYIHGVEAPRGLLCMVIYAWKPPGASTTWGFHASHTGPKLLAAAEAWQHKQTAATLFSVKYILPTLLQMTRNCYQLSERHIIVGSSESTVVTD